MLLPLANTGLRQYDPVLAKPDFGDDVTNYRTGRIQSLTVADIHLTA